MGLLAGTPHPETQIKIAPTFGEKPLMGGPKIGEILVAGPNVNSQRDWHPTGDSGFLNQQGQLVLTGPVNAIIDHKGTLWSPFVVDALAKQVDGVSRAAIFSIQHRLILALELQDNLSPKSIQSQKISLFPVDQIYTSKAFPVDNRHGGKIRYGVLREEIINFLGRA